MLIMTEEELVTYSNNLILLSVAPLQIHSIFFFLIDIASSFQQSKMGSRSMALKLLN